MRDLNWGLYSRIVCINHTIQFIAASRVSPASNNRLPCTSSSSLSLSRAATKFVLCKSSLLQFMFYWQSTLTCLMIQWIAAMPPYTFEPDNKPSPPTTTVAALLDTHASHHLWCKCTNCATMGTADECICSAVLFLWLRCAWRRKWRRMDCI